MDSRGDPCLALAKLSLSDDKQQRQVASQQQVLQTLNGQLFAQRKQSGDVTFYCAGDTGCEAAHEMVILLRSDYLSALLSGRWATVVEQGTRRAVSLSFFTRPVLTALLQYFYTGAPTFMRAASVEGREGGSTLYELMRLALSAGTVFFEGAQDAFDVLEASHFALLDDCHVLTADWLCASLAGSESPDTALRCLYAAGQALEHGSGVASLLKVAALKVLLPLGRQLAEADGAAVVVALGSCTPKECTALGLALVVDARDDTPLAARWSPQFGDEKLVSPRQASGSDETLCVVSLRATDVHVNWVDFEGDETHYSKLNLKSHVRGHQLGRRALVVLRHVDT